MIYRASVKYRNTIYFDLCQTDKYFTKTIILTNIDLYVRRKQKISKCTA